MKSLRKGKVSEEPKVEPEVPAESAAAMIGYVTMGMSLVPMIAPTIGGVLDEGFGWRASFAAMLILGAMLAVPIFAALT